MTRSQWYTLLEGLEAQHDAHMSETYSRFSSGEEVPEMFAYGAGMHHVIRTLRAVLTNEE